MGAQNYWVRRVDRIKQLQPAESARLDRVCLDTLYEDLGEAGAEDIICRAVEELAVRLSHCERCWRERQSGDLRKNVKSLIAIAEQIGMSSLVQVTHHVITAIDNQDDPAIAATLFRLIRLGDRSLTAVWNLARPFGLTGLAARHSQARLHPDHTERRVPDALLPCRTDRHRH